MLAGTIAYNRKDFALAVKDWERARTSLPPDSDPESTEQILHPDRYPDDKPVLVELPDLKPTLGDGWTELDSNVMGEWYTYLLLGKGRSQSFRLSEAQAHQAVVHGPDVHRPGDAGVHVPVRYRRGPGNANDAATLGVGLGRVQGYELRGGSRCWLGDGRGANRSGGRRRSRRVH